MTYIAKRTRISFRKPASGNTSLPDVDSRGLRPFRRPLIMQRDGAGSVTSTSWADPANRTPQRTQTVPTGDL